MFLISVCCLFGWQRFCWISFSCRRPEEFFSSATAAVLAPLSISVRLRSQPYPSAWGWPLAGGRHQREPAAIAESAPFALSVAPQVRRLCPGYGAGSDQV